MENILEQLQAAAQALLVISESEAPLTAFELDGDEEAEVALRRVSGQPADAPVEIQDAFSFLKKQERMYERQPQADRFAALSALLRTLLPDVQLYRIGSIRIDAFLIGTLPGGQRIGLRTQLVET